ncbi:pre-mRNA-splicing factor CWC22 homolog [Schistocerca cancellata]|uniref:pre-mRNA-splicing factor CWC22 homolog n=1 Tax=Schistocerca cancellata TaxID=274614 RepID=UPI0021187AE0|nr:pre-mRNA-splicing factor CWC22 homolog [Schistocerca cancellata]
MSRNEAATYRLSDKDGRGSETYRKEGSERRKQKRHEEDTREDQYKSRRNNSGSRYKDKERNSRSRDCSASFADVETPNHQYSRTEQNGSGRSRRYEDSRTMRDRYGSSHERSERRDSDRHYSADKDGYERYYSDPRSFHDNGENFRFKRSEYRNRDSYSDKSYTDRKDNKNAGSKHTDYRDSSKRSDHRSPKKDSSTVLDNRSKPTSESTATESANVTMEPPAAPAPQKKSLDMITSKTGGAYIPPAKLRMMQAQITDKTSAAYQRLAWEALKKSIHGHINKVNTGNIGKIVRELLRENIVRGRGLLCRSIIQAQAASPTFTHVYAALVAVINSKFPNIGELLLRRIVIQFRRGFRRNDKSTCISAVTFIAHLVNQRVAHEILALEILTLLIETPTDDSVEVAIAFLKECGMKLTEVSNKGVLAIFEMLRNILHEGHLEKRVQYMIEVIFQIRKDEFRDHVSVIPELDLVEEEDQFTHLITLDEAKNAEEILNVFKFDPEYETNEEKYNALKKELLDESSDESGSGSGSESEEEDSEGDSENEGEKEETILDNTETNLVALRRAIYLTIHSSLDFEECAHKLMRMELKPGQEIELCHMFLDCCAEQRTYEKFFGLLAQRFCQINKVYIPPFQQIFRDTYNTIHRLDTNKLRNTAKFFAHLLFTDAISWEVLSFIKLNEEDTTSSSRIFIKILFQELSEYMGLTKLNERVKDPTMQIAFDGLFPRDNPKNTRFAINFFTSIGLGGLTDELREHLKSQPKVSMLPALMKALSSSDSSSSTSDSSESSSSNTSSDSSSSSEEEPRKSKNPKKKKRKKTADSTKRQKTSAKKKKHSR